MAIYGSNFTGATKVNISGSGVTITSFAVYNAGSQVNAFFTAAANAQISQNVTVSVAQEPDSNSSPVAVVPVQVSLTQVGSIAISADGKYSEIANIQATAVQAPSGPGPGQIMKSFVGVVNIAEDVTATYVPVYTQNGGSLPASVSIQSGGQATLTATSLAGPNAAANGPPNTAQLHCTNYPNYGGLDLPVAQWVHTGAMLDPLASGNVPDWVQARTRDLAKAASANQTMILTSVSSYIVASLPSGQGQVTASHSAKSQVTLDPFDTAMRLDTDGGAFCGLTRGKMFTNTFFHEARHTYQNAQSALSGNDKDSDYLVNTVSIAPTSIFLDTTTVRTVCNEGVTPPVTVSLGYKGDSSADSFSVVQYALEEDAGSFANN